MDRLRHRYGYRTFQVRLFAILIVVILFLATSACAPQPADCSREDLFCVGLVTAFDGVEDHGLNQITWETLQNIEAQAQVARLDYIESIGARDWQKDILFFADNQYDVIVTVGTSLEEATRAVATGHSNISFIGVDQEFSEAHENIATISFPEEKAGFLAGTLAAMVTPTGKVGAVCETSGIDVVWQYCEGFRAGASYEKEDVEVTVIYRDSGDRDKTFNDPEWGQQQMVRLIEAGVDTMTAFGGGTAQGAFLAAGENGALVIGSEEDLYYRLPEAHPLVVSSILKDPAVELSSLVLSASRGEPIMGPHTGQISYTPFRMPQFATDLEIKSNMDFALQRIKNGEIEILLPEKR